MILFRRPLSTVLAANIIVATLFFIGFATVKSYAHEWTPTYPTFKYSEFEGVMKTTMTLFNKRSDVQYYMIGVFDENFNPIPFASDTPLVQINYLERKSMDIYIRKVDIDKVTYICTVSKLVKSDVESSGIHSRICSKVRPTKEI